MTLQESIMQWFESPEMQRFFDNLVFPVDDYIQGNGTPPEPSNITYTNNPEQR